MFVGGIYLSHLGSWIYVNLISAICFVEIGP